MGPKTQLLCQRLQQTISLLGRVKEVNWANRMRESLRRIENGDTSGIDYLCLSFGGMSSFNDLIISPLNWHSVTESEVSAVNTQLCELRNELYVLAQAIRRNSLLKDE